MSKDAQVTLKGLLGMLEEMKGPDDAVYSKIYRNHINLLKSINTVLCSDEVTATDADRVLRMCLLYKTDVRCVPYVFSIISTLINIDKEKSLNYVEKPFVDFLPSALAILDFLKTKCIEDNTSNLRMLSFQVLMSHPRTTLKRLVSGHSPAIIETFGLFLVPNTCEVLDAKKQSFIFLRLLEWLPAHEKSIFVKEGIPLWLSRVLPTLVEFLIVIEDKEEVEMYLHDVELLTKELIMHDYFEYPEWRAFLESIVDNDKFPACIKRLLELGKDTWHRIWIIFIKLLKSNVTRTFSSVGTPINSMLPVVETAFKKESFQRVRAFKCWNELIDNFSNETNENCIAKRVKLVIIPLKLNNAKTEDTAIAKFNTWWHLIRKFEPKIENFANEILIPFLHFVFGKNQVSKPTFRVVELSRSMRSKCLEAFAEIMGHIDCTTCTSDVPLTGKILSTILLADHWEDFLHALNAAIKVVATSFTPGNKAKIQCIWRSFVLRLENLAENSLRQDLFNDLIDLLADLSHDCKNYAHLTELLVTDITLPLFSDSRVRTLIKSKNQEHRPMHRLVAIITDKTLDSYYARFSPQDISKMLQPLIPTLVNEFVMTPAYVIWFLDDLPASDSALKLWTALVLYSTETDLCTQVLSNLLKWPLNTVHTNTDVKEAASAWYTLYNVVHVKLDKIGFDSEISKALTKPVEESKSANYFIMFALIGVLKHSMDEEKMAKLEALTYEMNDYNDFEQLMPPLIDTLALMLNSLSTDENLAQITINCVQNVLKVIDKHTESVESSSKKRETAISVVNTNILSIRKSMLLDIIISAMETYLKKCSNESIKKQIRVIISSFDKIDDKQAIESPKKTDIITVPIEFSSPKVKEVKKNKRKEASIVNTVVENGEEYVVVKSNWKFNAKNLTENQKEKFQRKRDIPALYQDLSQSQDEFKLSTWKTESQDTSLSSSKSSKSAMNNDAAEILLKMPSTDVVPNIMGNILGNDKTASKTDANASPVSKDKLPKVNKLVTPSTKSPRMALKDRVFRNVRNLIEKSSASLENEVIDKVKGANQIDNVSKSPVPKLKIESLVNPAIPETGSKLKNDDNPLINKQEHQSPDIAKSPDVKMKRVIIVTAKQNDQNITLVCTPATKTKKDKNDPNVTPPLLIPVRPARMKKTPKKFDDSMLLALKKKRYSKNESQSDSQDSQDTQTEITVTAQVHTSKSKNDNTLKGIDIDLKPLAVQTTNKDEVNKSLSVPDDVILLDENIPINCDVSDIALKPLAFQTTKKDELNKPLSVPDDGILLNENIPINCDVSKVECHKSAEVPLISPATPVTDKPTANSPEKPTTTGEVPSNMSKASEGIKEVEHIEKELSTVETPLNTPKRCNQKKSSILKTGSQNDTPKSSDNSITLTNSLRKIRKAKVQNENSTNDENIAAFSTPVITIMNQQKSTAKRKFVRNETDKESEKLEAKQIKKAEDVSQPKSMKKAVEHKQTDAKSGSESTPLNKTEEVSQENLVEKNNVKTENNKSEQNLVLATPKNKIKNVAQKSYIKTTKKSRIEKELMIDMVEGHPFLKIQSEKRLTRKKILEAENNGRRKSLAEKLNSSKLEATPKTSKKPKEKKTSPSANTVTVEESQDKPSNSPKAVMDELPCSEDIIESSQDSTITTISIKSTKRTQKLQPFVCLEPIDKIYIDTVLTQDLIRDEMKNIPDKENHERTDIEFPQNKTVEADKNITDITENFDTEPMGDTKNTTDITEDMDTEPMGDTKNTTDLTENMDTEPIGDTKNTTDLTENMDTEPLSANNPDERIILSETLQTPITLNTEPIIGPETQELAEADTLPLEPNMSFEISQVTSKYQKPNNMLSENKIPEKPPIETKKNDITQGLAEAVIILANMDKTNEVSSPFKDDSQRKQDFLNNTLEISPIKIQSPDRAKKSPSPETSSDFVVIQLSSPVNSNGEPFEKPGSPEFFSEDKVSPDKRDASPPRAEVTVANTSPSSSLSLKKNRPQVRPSGRAAQMLDLLCVNSDLMVTKVSERPEPEETKKSSTSTPARRNLRILYGCVSENSDNLPEQNVGEDPENFLKLNRILPMVNSSPSGPILKRKLAEIMDEATASPASKRKRVSFHDPPVSTTISVHKYIEPLSLVRSPQSSAKKRQTRSGIKAPKRLENAFSLDSVLSKAVESFTEATPTDDTENISLDVTPAVEIVKTSDLNDTDPICPDLIDCKDSIEVIATELSSPAMRELFVKELEGKVETVGDLAKMTELEVNRLCIKAPKIQVAKKVLTDYVTNRPAIGVETAVEEALSEPMTESLLNECKMASVEMQTDRVEFSSIQMQTVAEPMVLASTQTEIVPTAHTSIQTDISGSETTADIISYLSKREDFLDKLSEKLDNEQLRKVADKLPPKSMFELLIQKSDYSTTTLQSRLLKYLSKGVSKDNKSNAELTFLCDHLCERYEGKDLMLFCSQLLKKVYDKPA